MTSNFNAQVEAVRTALDGLGIELTYSDIEVAVKAAGSVARPTPVPLFESDHPYYGPEGSYWASPAKEADYHHRFESWKDFAEGESFYNADIDMNWCYRWDWQTPNPDDYKYELEENPNFTLPGEVLELFWMMPRKGIMATTQIKVTREDEPAVRAWLQKFADYMVTMWAPFDLSPKEV
ncbi:hypothetical protein FDH86_gp045 [Arthrobacter phage Tank]|uniref:Uncharacterized protein n=2 Tax=Tankvirus tank TaxID=1982567 RepID=A0A0U4JKR9_9CAUD|nr:hypothetical protein FDH86_gp045 [Arthrobacter phage Tank]ALY10580.1 hypothetical protein TANK_45 [Arthrobacter phage Tank]ALY10829.1 hypothetical protein WILDE_45 [Arthrobacter phage Wilde]